MCLFWGREFLKSHLKPDMKSLLFYLIIIYIGIFNTLYINKPLKQSMIEGKEIYDDFCVRCHLDNGMGEKGKNPPLANSDYLENIDKTIQSIKFGLRGPIWVNGEIYDSVMEYQGLDDEEIADVVNYILNSWGNKHDQIITEEKVSSIDESI